MNDEDRNAQAIQVTTADPMPEAAGAPGYEGQQAARRKRHQAGRAASQRDASTAPSKPVRRRWIWAVLGAMAIAGVAVGVRYYLYARDHESTDDAFIEGHVVPVSPRVAGHVAKVYVNDNQWVNQGDLLVELDPRDFEARLAAAEAGLKAAQGGRKSRTIHVDLTDITSSAGVEGASAAVEEAKADVETARAAVTAAESRCAEAEAQLVAAQAALEQSRAEVRAAEARAASAASHLERVRSLVPQHAASQESLDDAAAAHEVAQADIAAAQQRVHAQEAAIRQAQAAVAAASSALKQTQAAVAGRLAALKRAEAQLASAKSAPQQVAQSRSETEVAGAEVARAEAEVQQANLNLSYTRIYAPTSGHVTRKSVEPGAYVQIGQSLMAVVEPDVWVVANFKETQLTKMRPGQPASVVVDIYPGVEFAAHVDSIQRGSGARFSLLPPENATGNFVKVVQRVPVKIVFDDPKQVAEHLLGPGMSVVPTVDIHVAGDPKFPAPSLRACLKRGFLPQVTGHGRRRLSIRWIMAM